MGYYLQVPYNTEKPKYLIMEYGAQVWSVNHNPKSVLEAKGDIFICVVKNGPFDACGIVYSQNELEAFSLPEDPRVKTWLTMDRKKVFEMCPQVEKAMQY